MKHTKANLRALRDLVGYSQQDLAGALGVNPRSVKRWEDPDGEYWAPEAAWEVLEGALNVQRQMVDYAVAQCERVTEEAGRMPGSVPITYYRDQRMYDGWGRDPGSYGIANANARAVWRELDATGYPAEMRYPVPEVEDTHPKRKKD